jgi:hypothetical protein
MAGASASAGGLSTSRAASRPKNVAASMASGGGMIVSTSSSMSTSAGGQ